MTKQEQSLGDGAEAYQAGGDIVIHKGFGTEDMADLMMAMAKQMSAYTEQANAKLEERLNEFRDEVLQQFSDENSANREAFNDPDFQYTVRSAQEAFARSGDSDLKVELVRLLTERSKNETGTRVSNILNEAIRVGGLLTKEEMSALSVLFFMLNVGFSGNNITFARNIFDRYLSAFVGDIPSRDVSFEYLTSLGCISYNTFMSRSAADILAEKFKGQFAGFDDGQKIRDELVKSDVLRAVFDKWDAMRAFQGSNLTLLGKVLAHSACVSKSGLDAPLEVWVS